MTAKVSLYKLRYFTQGRLIFSLTRRKQAAITFCEKHRREILFRIFKVKKVTYSVHYRRTILIILLSGLSRLYGSRSFVLCGPAAWYFLPATVPHLYLHHLSVSAASQNFSAGRMVLLYRSTFMIA